MKETRIIALITFLCLVLAFPALVSAKTITLSLSDNNSEISWGPVHATQPWVKQVEKVTNGRVKIQIYPSQTLAKAKQNWKAVKDGIADMAWLPMHYYQGLTPYADVISLPGIPIETAEEGSAVLWKLFEKFPEMSGQFGDNKVLLLHTGQTFFILSRKKQIKTLEDIKGLKIRSTGGPLAQLFKKLGVAPMFISMPDCYVAMQRGTVDGMVALWEPIPGYRLNEVSKHITTNVPLTTPYFAVIMNKGKWNSLPKDIQEAIMSISGLEGSKFFGRNFFDSSTGPVLEKIKNKEYKLTVYRLPDEERARWVDVAVKPVWDDWINKMEKEGYTKAREVLNATLDILK